MICRPLRNQRKLVAIDVGYFFSVKYIRKKIYMEAVVMNYKCLY